MKKSGTIVIAGLLTLVFFHADVFAKDDTTPKESTGTAVPKRTSADEQKITELRKRTQDARKDLNGSSWAVELRALDKKNKDEKDKFTFQDGMFKSDHYIDLGYTPTNYSITLSGAETESAVWETMLSSKEGQIFIRGEWEKEKMSGNITEQLDGGKKVVERFFTTEARKTIPTESKAKEDLPKEGAPDVTPFAPGTTEESR